MGVKILTDSTSYIDEKVRKLLNIKIVSLNILFKDDCIREMDIDNVSFYKRMEKEGIPTSSQPSIGELFNEMESVVEVGDDLLCIFLSSDMSGTYSTGLMVKKMILEKHKDAKIEILDSRSNSMQLGFAVMVAAKASGAGKTLEQVKTAVQENIKRSRFLFVPNNLEYLKKGGRIGGAAAIIGNLLKIIPILTVENGRVGILTKVRTKKNAINIMIDKMVDDINKFGIIEIVVHHINCYEEAKELVNKIKEKININVNILDIGPVIGLHVGPGTVGIVYYTEKNLI